MSRDTGFGKGWAFPGAGRSVWPVAIMAGARCLSCAVGEGFD